MTQAGSSFHYMGSKIAEAEGVEMSFKPLQKTGAVIGAIKTGQIDAWSIVPNIAATLADSGAVKIIGEVADYIPNYQVTTVFTSTQNAEQQQEQTKAFLQALARGTADYNAALVDKTANAEDTDAIVKLVAGYVYPDQPIEESSVSILAGAMRINADMALNKASVQDQIDWFKAQGLVKDTITYDTLVDESFVEIVS